MAGGKETPRQKMIGMMYLVLLALLALQVSSSVLEKFVFINGVLEKSAHDSGTRNAETIERIAAAVDQAGNLKEDKAVLDLAKEVREETKRIIAEIDKHKKAISEFNPETKELNNSKDEEIVANYFINKKNGVAVKNLMNDYSAKIEEKVNQLKQVGNPLKLDRIGKDAKEIDQFKNNPEKRSLGFEIINFSHTPVAAALATLSQFETEILNQESQALEKLALAVGATQVKFDKIVPMVRANSNVVAAGTKYEAEMFIAASSSGITPLMKHNGKPIPVEDGMGKVTFTASADSYDKEGLSRQTYEAAITINSGGKDTTYKQMIEYYVAKPVIQVQSASVQALYNNCGNELNIQVPALGSAYAPRFTANGAATYPGAEKGLVTIVPSGVPEVALNVYSGDFLIGTEKFKVRGIPKPDIKLLSRGKEVNEKIGESAPGPRVLTVAAIPDDSFKQFLPKDARYRVTEWEVTLARGPRPVTTLKFNSPDADLSNLAAQAKPGDRLVIEVKKVERMNFRDQREAVNVGVVIKQIPLN
jgi:gliding motility-associated protein GldM